jgi:predicted ATPase
MGLLNYTQALFLARPMNAYQLATSVYQLATDTDQKTWPAVPWRRWVGEQPNRCVNQRVKELRLA